MIQTWLPLPEIVQTGKPYTAINQQDEGAAFFQELVEPIFAMSYPATQVAGPGAGLGERQEPGQAVSISGRDRAFGASVSPSIRHRSALPRRICPAFSNVTRRMAARFNLTDRFEFLPGDFHDVDFGTGYNLATLGHILHSLGSSNAASS